MTDVLFRPAPGALQVRAGSGNDRIVEGIVVPWGAIATVRDGDGPVYRESIARGAISSDPTKVRLEGPPVPGTAPGRHDGHLIGRGLSGEDRTEGYWMSFRIANTAAGDDAYELAREGVLTDFSVGFHGRADRRLRSGVLERTEIDLRRVALLENGAYDGADVTAVRAAVEDNSMTQPETPAPEPTPEPPADPAPELQRAAVERSTVAELTRNSAPAMVTRPELVYGPSQRTSFLRDLLHRGNDAEAAGRQGRHYAMLADIVSRAGTSDANGNTIIDWSRIERAGDVLTTELGGAIPTEFLPGLLVPRIMKGRPMGSFYQSFGITDARPRTFPKVSVSTTTTVQSAEGVNPPASDFATTAVTATPALRGGSTLASRQALDSGDPSVEQMVMQDLYEAYAQDTETAIKVAVEAGATARTAPTAATPYAGLVKNVIEFQTNRFTPADRVFVPSVLYATLLAQPDTTGRPLVPFYGPQNSDARVTAGAAGAYLLDVPTVHSWASTTNVSVIGQSSDYVIYESAIAEFRVELDATITPANILLGLWSYLAIGVRRGSDKSTAA